MQNKKCNFIYGDRNQDDVTVTMYNCEKLAVVSQERIENYIREGVNYLIKNDSENSWYTQTGDTLIFITRDDEKSLVINVATPRSYGFTSGGM